jgi:hypothetical protein
VVAIAAVILVVPSFALLFTLQGRRMLGGGEHGTLPTVGSRRLYCPDVRLYRPYAQHQ